MKIAIIGAGLAGLTLASALSEVAEIVVFEKSHGLGGRLAHRRRHGFMFDHGAQYFTARTPAFHNLVERLMAADAAGSWPDTIATLPRQDDTPKSRPPEPRYVGVPSMSAAVAQLGAGLDIRREAHVAALSHVEGLWRLDDGEGQALGLFDWVVSTVPAPQAAVLMPAAFAHHSVLRSVVMSGCFTLMIGCHQAPDLRLQAARLDHPVLSWMAVNSSKPGRGGPFSLVVHSRNDWAEQHLEDDRGSVTQTMLAGLEELTGQDFSSADWIDLHRWRYANVERAAEMPFLLDAGNRLAACGDWCISNRVESAFESAGGLADALRAMIEAG